ncbi:hypothetical protein E4U53_003012 [Claviceps sorghi]|nr:hypothetical protein E4U53_003012 [Claviceps sorghi]
MTAAPDLVHLSIFDRAVAFPGRGNGTWMPGIRLLLCFYAAAPLRFDAIQEASPGPDLHTRTLNGARGFDEGGRRGEPREAHIDSAIQSRSPGRRHSGHTPIAQAQKGSGIGSVSASRSTISGLSRLSSLGSLSSLSRGDAALPIAHQTSYPLVWDQTRRRLDDYSREEEDMMKSSPYFDIYSNLPQISQPQHPHIIGDLDHVDKFANAAGHAFMPFSSDHLPVVFPTSVVVDSESAVKALADAFKSYRYPTPDGSTAQSPSISSEEFSFHPSVSHRSCRSVISPDRDYGYNSSSGRSSTQGPSGMDLTHTTGFLKLPMEHPMDISHTSQLPLLPSGCYEDMERQGVFTRTFDRPSHHNVPPGTAIEDAIMGMSYDEPNQDRRTQSSFDTQRTAKEEYCVDQGIFQRLLDPTPSFTLTCPPLSYCADTAEKPSHMSPSTSLPSNTHVLGSRHQQVVASSSSFSNGNCSNCKSCKKKVPNLHDSTPCQALYCLFGFAGCDCRCKGKNEWKRHVKTQHLLSRLYTCPDCSNKNFNRKDLFSQHYIRMHTSQAEKEAVKMKKTTPEFDKKLEDKQAEAERDEASSPPEVPTCLFQGCDARFANDGTAWDKCLDHVSKHLEAMVAGKEAFRNYNFTHQQLAHFETLGAITQADHGRWVLGPQSNGERARENKKKIGKRPADADAVDCHKVNKRHQKGNH